MKKVVFSIILFCWPWPVLGALEVVINEIAWMGSKVADIDSKNWWRYEWLELYNPGSEKIILDGWKIEFWRNELDFSIMLKGSIGASGYYLIASSDKIPGYDLNYANLGGKMNNNGEDLSLINDSGQRVDEVTAFSGSGWFAGDNALKNTMERVSVLESGSLPQNWKSSSLEGGTPQSSHLFYRADNEEPEEFQEAVPAPQVNSEEAVSYPEGILINEILPSPNGPDENEEWIEIFNSNKGRVDLSGWEIRDTAGNTTLYTLPPASVIEPFDYLLLLRPETKISLNNQGDGVELLRPDGNIADTIQFLRAESGKSYSRFGPQWQWEEPSPKKANITSALKQKEMVPASFQPKNSENPPQYPDINLNASVGDKRVDVSWRTFGLALLVGALSAMTIFSLKRFLTKRGF